MTQPIPRSQSAVAERLPEIVGERHVLRRQLELLVSHSACLHGYRRPPHLAVFAGPHHDTSAIVRLRADEDVTVFATAA